MPLTTYTVRQLLEEQALPRLIPLQTDLRLTAAQRALAGELVQADTLALNALRPDNTIVPGQRTARAQNIWDKVFALNTVQAATEAALGIDTLYNGMDASDAAAWAISRGDPTRTINLDTRG